MAKFICKNCGNVFPKDVKTSKVPSVQCPKCKSLFTEFLCSDNVDIKTNVKIQTNMPQFDFSQIDFNRIFNEFMLRSPQPNLRSPLSRDPLDYPRYVR